MQNGIIIDSVVLQCFRFGIITLTLDGNARFYCVLNNLFTQYDITTPSDPLDHPRPLFVHANLLKHRKRVPLSDLDTNQTAVGAPSPFSIIKRAANDISYADTLDEARMWVYMKHGMCVDLVVNSPPRETTHFYLEATGPNHVVEERLDEVHGGVFADFTNMYRRHGGRVEGGGW